MATDPAFAHPVAAWQQRLTQLVAHVAPMVPPVDLWGRIEAAIDLTGARVPPFRRHIRFWQGSTGVALAIAASLAAFIVLHRPELPRVAVLSQ